MSNYTIELVIRVVVALVLMVVLGNGCTVMFNRMPSEWFRDYPEDGSEAMVLPEKLLRSIEEGRQRLPSTPWKYIFCGFFGIAGVYLAVSGSIRFEVAVLLALAVLLEMAIADALYQIVPDQLSVLLAVSAVGFVSFHDNWWEPAAGAGVGALLAMAMYGLGRLIYRRETIGGADIKFYLAIGCVSGRLGVICIFLLTSVFSAIYAVYVRTVVRRDEDRVPMLPSAWLATAVYMLFLWNRLGVINL